MNDHYGSTNVDVLTKKIFSFTPCAFMQKSMSTIQVHGPYNRTIHGGKSAAHFQFTAAHKQSYLLSTTYRTPGRNVTLNIWWQQCDSKIGW